MGAGGAGTRPLGYGRHKPAVAIREAVELIRRLQREGRKFQIGDTVWVVSSTSCPSATASGS